MTTVTQHDAALAARQAATPSTIVVPVDGGDLSIRALAVGRHWARAFGAALLVLAARGHDRAALAASCADPGTPRAIWRTVGEGDELVQAVLQLVAADPSVVVCAGTRGCSPLVDVLADDLAQEILRAVDVPVLLVGPHCTTAALDGPLVVAHDGTAGGDAVLAPVLVWATALDVPPLVLHVRQTLVPDGSEVAQTLHRARERLGPEATLHMVRSSFPAGAIREYAREVDARVLALSTRGRTDTLTASTGHTATWVVRESPCPVLVAHPPATSAP